MVSIDDRFTILLVHVSSSFLFSLLLLVEESPLPASSMFLSPLFPNSRPRVDGPPFDESYFLPPPPLCTSTAFSPSPAPNRLFFVPLVGKSEVWLTDILVITKLSRIFSLPDTLDVFFSFVELCEDCLLLPAFFPFPVFQGREPV